MEPIHLYEVHNLVKLMTAIKDPSAIQSVFDVVKNVKAPYKITDFVRSATMSKNPAATEAVSKWYGDILKQATKALPLISHVLLAPVVIPKQAVDQLKRMRTGEIKIKT